MKMKNIEALRGELVAYLKDKGHGAVNAFADQVGVSNQTVRRFRDGENLSTKALEKIAQGLTDTGYTMKESTEEYSNGDDPLRKADGILSSMLDIVREPSAMTQAKWQVLQAGSNYLSKEILPAIGREFVDKDIDDNF